MDPQVIIIGSGQAGVPLATRLAAKGKEVVVIERGAPGGTCVNYGCTPTKTMIASARAAHVARTGGRLGVHAENVRVDFAAVVARKNAVVRQWREGVERKLRGHERINFIAGHARFVGAREIDVGGRRLRADTMIINVGARPSVPPLPGLDTVPWLDNATAMDLSELPSHLVVLGGGYIGCELGQMFRRFGAEVTVVDRAPHLLGKQDEEVSAELERVFANEGIGLELGAKIQSVAKTAGGVVVSLEGGKQVHGSHLLVATGRRPNTDDLGCDAARIQLDDKGFVAVDDQYRSSAAGIFAVGDAINQPQFTHVSWDDHRILFDILMGRSSRGRGGRHVPYAVFTDPQIAGVGLSEREAREQGLQFEVATMPFGNIARAIEVDEPAGLLKLLVDKEDHIVGASIMGAEAGELIHVFVALMQAGASLRAVVDAEFVHPTFAEGLQSLAMKLKRFALD
jgi:pyruvate/2-oxoglutarate dehydrogenase complex dihydrolipoamide dehydrogenase (E3) component